MINFSNVINNFKTSYLKEKDYYIKLIKKRANIFIKEAKEVQLPIYPYHEGFFVTIKISEDIKNRYHKLLLDNDIFAVPVNKGIRIALCSLPIKKCSGLASKLKNILNKIKD